LEAEALPTPAVIHETFAPGLSGVVPTAGDLLDYIKKVNNFCLFHNEDRKKKYFCFAGLFL
jgi:hypothetical protein